VTRVGIALTPRCPPPDLDFATRSFRLSTRYDQPHSPALLELLGCHPVRIWRIAGTHVPFLLVVRILRTNPPGVEKSTPHGCRTGLAGFLPKPKLTPGVEPSGTQ
jgi:hypothetical protein